MDTPFSENERRPWERLPQETDKQFRAYTLFRNQGVTRSMTRAYKEYSGNENAANIPKHFHSWRRDNFWDKRNEAYDRYMDSAGVEAQREAKIERARERGRTLADLEADTIQLGHEAYTLAMDTIGKAEETMLAKDWNNLVGQIVNLYATLSKTKGETSGPKPGEIPALTDEELDRMFGTPEEQEKDGEYS